MQNLSKEHVLSCIHQELPISGRCEGFYIQIKEYSPSIATAIHNGHSLSKDLLSSIQIDESDRLYEEDPYTEDLISSQPIRLIGLDSRYEYDLNRSPSDCIYSEAWGESVWKEKLPEKLRLRAMKKHRIFYHVLHALIAKLEQLYEVCVVYDIHSYNSNRIPMVTPDINLGTHYIKGKRWREDVRSLVNHFRSIGQDDRVLSFEQNKVFQGKGYLAQFVSDHFDRSLAMPIEFKKIFMNEKTGEVYPMVLSLLKENVKTALSDHANEFVRRHTRHFNVKKTTILPSNIEPVVLEVDRSFYQLAKKIDILHYVNPVNLQQEQQKFFRSGYNKEPNFKYRQLTVDPYSFREKLYRLPLHRIQDVSLQRLYQRTIDVMASKINLMTSLGTDQFLYHSLICYGEPDEIDIRNSEFLMFTPDFTEGDSDPIYDAEYAKASFEEAMLKYKLNYPIVISSKIVAGAMVDSTKKKILLHPHRKWTRMEVQALVHHELGVHALTTENSHDQPLEIFKLGLPGNTKTQEGLAILSEYQSGNLTLKRLKTLALRNIATKKMLRREKFSSVFEMMMDEYRLSEEDAFRIVARVFRGGGFTKDHLYLKGFQKAVSLFQENVSFESLYIGKTGFDDLDLLDELIERRILPKPKRLPLSLTFSCERHSILEYLVSSIQSTKEVCKAVG
jgi:uncharacterized protein (TIGR02421 family)